MQRILLLCLTVLFFALSACGSFQTVKDSWKYTQKQYRSYLNTPAEIDLEDKGSCELYELALSEAVIDVDEELQKLIRAMENSDHNPDQVWVVNIMRHVPWLSGVALVDNTGTVVAQYPEYFSKPFDASPLVEPDPKQRLGALRAYVHMTEAGPEVYVGNPVYGGQELRGIIVAYFDPRVLVMASSDPGSFMMASPAGVLWPGRYGAGGVVGSTDWENLLRRESCGVIGSKEGEFFWTTRYVGNLPLIYALPTSAGRETMLPGEDPAPPVSSRRASSASSGAAAAPEGEASGDAGVESSPLTDAQPAQDGSGGDAPVGTPAGTPVAAPAPAQDQPAGTPAAVPAPGQASGQSSGRLSGQTQPAQQGAGTSPATPSEESQLAWPERAPDFTAPIQAPKAEEAAASDAAQPAPAENEKAAQTPGNSPDAQPPADGGAPLE